MPLSLPQGLEHLMHNLGLGGLEFPAKHTLDDHRPADYKAVDLIPGPNSNETTPKPGLIVLSGVAQETEAPTTSSNTLETDAIDATSTTVTAASADKGYEIIMNVFDSNKREDVFHKMHDPFHRHPRFRGTRSQAKTAAFYIRFSSL